MMSNAAFFHSVESLESRRLLTATATLSSAGVLEIRGDAANDVITASTPRANPNLSVNLNGHAQSFPAASVKSLLIDTGPGNDKLTLSGAFWRPTTINLGDGDDLAFAGGKNDLIHGGNGNDTVNASAGNDTVFGDAGNDVLEGAENSDTVSGGPGDDVLGGWDGYNTLDGGEGNDTFYALANGRGTITGGAGFDRVWVQHSTPNSAWSFKDTDDVRR